MKLKIAELQTIAANIENLLTKDVPVLTAFKLSSLVKKISPELQSAEEIRNKLVKKYGKEKNGQFSISLEDKEAMDKFIEEYKPISEKEIEIKFKPLKVSELGDIKVSTITIMAILPLLELEQDE